jgi:hypothetical protein
MAEQSRQGPRAYRGPVRRLRVTVVDGAWQVAKETRVDRMTLPRSRRLPEGRTSGGAFVEAVDAKGNVVYRQSIQDPTRPSVEIHDPERSHRVEAPGREVMLDVMVPDTDDVASLRVIVDRAELPFRKGRGKPKPGGYDVRKGGK